MYDSIILPSPLEVLDSFIYITQNENILKTITITFLRLILGLFSASTLGIGIGLGMGINKKFKDFIYPFIIFLQAAPVISFILLALIWFDTPFIPIFVLCINSFPNLAINVYEGIANVDKKLLEMSNFYKVKKSKLIKKLYIPSIISHILASARIILSNAFKITVMAEVICKSSNGIGSKINWAWINIETANIFVWTIIIVILSFAIEKQSIKYLKRRFDKYYG
jgi:NitT/TauT family transport system permease protein